MRTRIAPLLMLSLACTLASCGSDDDATPATPESEQPADDGGSGDGGGSDDEGAAGHSGDGLPESVCDDFPVDIPDGWQIDIQGEIGMTNTSNVQLLYPADRFDDLVAFYDDWTEGRPEEYARTEANEDVSYSRLDGEFTTIRVAPDEQRGDTWTLLQVAAGGC